MFKSPIGELKLLVEEEVLVGVGFGERNQKSKKVNENDKLKGKMIADQLGEYFEGKRKDFDLVYGFRVGTEFQRKVWGEIAKIPYGEVVTYKELAEKVGRPKAYRAVASACGKNSLPVVVPCHRVVGSPSASLRVNSFVENLGGYSGGLWRKEWLLELEGVKIG